MLIAAAIFIRRLKQSTGFDDCQAISIRRLKGSHGIVWIAWQSLYAD